MDSHNFMCGGGCMEEGVMRGRLWGNKGNPGRLEKVTLEAVRISMLRVQYCKKKPVIPGYPPKTFWRAPSTYNDPNP